MTAPLEARFQRLLRTYPVAYRRAHGDDMLTTMLADAGPGQRWPRPGDAANVAFHGLRLRLFKRSRGEFFDAGWGDACAVLGPVIALLLFALRLPYALALPAKAFRWPFTAPTLADVSLLSVGLQTLAWAGVAVAALAGLRRTAALLGWAALLAEVVPLARLADEWPVGVVQGLWRVVIGLVAAVALSAGGARRVTAVLGRWRFGAVLAALAVFDVIAVALRPGSARMDDDGGIYRVFQFSTDGGPAGYSIESASSTAMNLALLGLAVAVIAFFVAVLTVPGRIRRRLLIAVAPVVALLVLIDTTLSGWMTSTDHMGHPIPLVPVQWIALVGVPLLTFLIGLRWLRRRDDLLRLAALGRSLDPAD